MKARYTDADLLNMEWPESAGVGLREYNALNGRDLTEAELVRLIGLTRIVARPVLLDNSNRAGVRRSLGI